MAFAKNSSDNIPVDGKPTPKYYRGRPLDQDYLATASWYRDHHKCDGDGSKRVVPTAEPERREHAQTLLEAVAPHMLRGEEFLKFKRIRKEIAEREGIELDDRGHPKSPPNLKQKLLEDESGK